ncbi:MAG: RnfABCDGE type electron transport complex subunit D [Spirochaetales bacterium]|nr:RnfABCDGE type electron transport complex subunit D [Spirochaetales bacterium]
MTRNRYPIVSAAPFIHVGRSTSSLCFGAAAALLPAFAWSSWIFGPRVLLVAMVSIAAALLSEGGANLLARRYTLGDGSALLSALILAAAMPPGVALHIPALSASFAILVVKWSFGGLGGNWMNPALAGIAFAQVNWHDEMLGGWVMPRILSGVDGLSASTPLGYLADATGGARVSLPLEVLKQAGYPVSAFDGRATGFLNDHVFGPLGAELPGGYVDLALGFRPGAIGEVAGILLLFASVILISRKMIRWEAPFSALLAFGFLARLFGGAGGDFMSGDALFALFSGGFILTAVFALADPVTTPVSRPALALFGAGAGALAFAFRRWGALPDGSAYAVLIMNALVPLLDKAFPPSGRARKRRDA